MFIVHFTNGTNNGKKYSVRIDSAKSFDGAKTAAEAILHDIDARFADTYNTHCKITSIYDCTTKVRVDLVSA